MYEKVTSKITDSAILLWLSVGRIYFFLSFIAINWTSEISLQCDIISQAWIFRNENSSSSSWRWSSFTDFSYSAIRHSFCRECQDGARVGKQRRLDCYHGVTNFWTIWSISRCEYYFSLPISRREFLPFISRRENFHWSFTAWLVSRHEWNFFAVEWNGISRRESWNSRTVTVKKIHGFQWNP